MSNTKQKRARKPVNNSANRRVIDLTNIESFLSSLNLHVNPSVHVNGHQHPNVALVVDFGQPLEPISLEQDQIHNLMDHMRTVTRTLFGKENLNVRVTADQSAGIYWTTVA